RATMDSWIFQGGYPMVSVEASPDGTSVTLTQHRFTYRGSDDGSRWQVPIMLRAAMAEDGAEHRTKVLLNDAQTTVHLPGKAEWVLVNDGAWGFYRVRYEADLLRRL